MSDYTYVTTRDVQKVCRDLGISDWTKLTAAKVNNAEAEVVRKVVGGETRDISLEDFRIGLEVELEHGIQFPDANVTNNHPILTGRIVLAHLKEGLDYYLRLDCMELEMELAQALAQKNAEESQKIRRNLAVSRAKLETRLVTCLS